MNILMAADGEGRNGVYAATKGWEVTAFDLSLEGKKKAESLALEYQVSIDYHVGDFAEMTFPQSSFGALGLIYAHFGAEHKLAHCRRLNEYLQPGSVVILEAFSKNHLDFQKKYPHVGGPKNPEILWSLQEVSSCFQDHEVLYQAEKEVVLNEGKYHVGTGAVVRWVSRKQV
ncbi:class I SAM-dependent methyltransferase [Marinoscillum sp.]|uniref:class I SAM-dependent methyltransferase n=1 Tax=Marinoscillum sp. TaxID=2024838 RepID=UPI003BAAAD77